MGNRVINIGMVDTYKASVADLVHKMAGELPDCRYIDLRLEVGEGQGAVAQDGMMKFSIRDYGISYGVRVIAGNNTFAPGYFGQTFGTADVTNLAHYLESGIKQAYRRAIHNAACKESRKEEWGMLGSLLWSTELAKIQVCQDIIPATYTVNPIEVPLEKLNELVKDISTAVKSSDPRIKLNEIIAETSLSRQLFISSEGANIDQTTALTYGLCVVVAVGSTGVNQSHYDCIGHQRGLEVLTEGVSEQYAQSQPLMNFALDLANDAASLSEARPCPSLDKEVIIVTDPSYNALKVHEIMGHPSELDRALKMETAYAGRSWFLKNLDKNMLGKQVASPLVSAYSDPSLPGFGHYQYDDEGTPAKRVVHIDRGIFAGFMNSRQTAAITGSKPNAHYKATDASYVPLIRMSATNFAAGNSNPAEIIKEVDHGYYLVGHRIPSISESRENFRITARKIFEISNGEIGEMFRDGGIFANTRDYLMNVDAVGNDLRIFPIFNCGKGQPMQTKKLSNGSPTMRSRAKLVGSAR